MRNLIPLDEHQELLNIWKDTKSDKDSAEYWDQVIIAAKTTREYFLNLDSSQMFNNTLLKKFNYDAVDGLQCKQDLDQAVDVTKIIGHTGHLKISDSLHSWHDILLNKLKCQTISYLINSILVCGKLYYDIDIADLEFTKSDDEYYFSARDGLHRTVLAKYILSHNSDKFLRGVKVIYYE